jgi:hypothetical protein
LAAEGRGGFGSALQTDLLIKELKGNRFELNRRLGEPTEEAEVKPLLAKPGVIKALALYKQAWDKSAVNGDEFW